MSSTHDTNITTTTATSSNDDNDSDTEASIDATDVIVTPSPSPRSSKAKAKLQASLDNLNPRSPPHRPTIDPSRRVGVVVTSSRNSVTEMRQSGVMSGGASAVLMIRNTARYTGQRSSIATSRKPTYITSLMEDMQWALKELDCPNVSALEKTNTLEEWAIFVHASLTNESRGYHGVPHVFEISAGASPMQLLAAIFRDVTNHYIDGEEEPSAKHAVLLQGVLQEGTCVLQTFSVESDERLALVAALFGYTPGTDLTLDKGLHKGLDVFLSAVAASRLLQDTLSLKQTAQLCALLEATIPFRNVVTSKSATKSATTSAAAAAAATTTTTTTKSAVADGGVQVLPSQQPLDQLFCRLEQANTDFKLQMTYEEMEETVQLGADLTNRNIGNMVTDDLAEFLSHTWSLLPEQNIALRQFSLFTMHDFYDAVSNMVCWVQNMKAESIYSTFRGVPDQEEAQEFHEQLTFNLHAAVSYLQARLLSVGVVAAFAALTGGDAPFSFFFGDAPSVNRVSAQLGDGLVVAKSKGLAAQSLLWNSNAALDSSSIGIGIGDSGSQQQTHAQLNINEEVLDLLEGQGMDGTFFDKGSAPLAFYLYEHLGGYMVSACLEKCHLEFNEESAMELLQFLPVDVFLAVAKELSRFIVSRSKAIARLEERVLAAHRD
jgi:hypothetical protein